MEKNKIKLSLLGHRNREILLMVSIGIVVGVITGVIGIVFNLLINWILNKLMTFGNIDIRLKFFALPIIAGGVIGSIMKLALEKDKSGFGVVPVMQELLHIQTFLMKPKDVFIKLIGTIISICGGLSVGRFGPIVHLGGAIGSNIGYLLKFNQNHIRLLIGCGVAGSIAGVFNAPIFASIFVLEILFNKKFLEYFTPIVLSSVTSIIISRYYLGDYTLISIGSNYGLTNYSELVNYALLGIFIGIVSTIYSKTIVGFKVFFTCVSKKSRITPLVGGVLVAIIGFFVPEIFEMYHFTIHKITAGNYELGFLCILVLAKILATAISLGSGALGGSFTPGLFVGAAAGSIFARLSEVFIMVPIFSYGTYAVVGMGAMFAGFANAPLTATIMVLEITDNYLLILPILLSTTVGSITSELIYEGTIYSASLNLLEEEQE